MKRILKNVIFIAIFLIILVLVLNKVYKKIGYGYFKKAISKSGVTFFTRDNRVTYSNKNSYKIENKDYNNATFYKEITLKKNTPYKISCMIKTEGVEVQNNKQYQNSGAKICILNSSEQSQAITGTSNWQESTLYINTKQNEKISVGFTLGGSSYSGNVKGEAWFSDLKIEEGTWDEGNDWNVVCLVLKNTDIKLFDVDFKYAMSEQDIKQIKDCMERFKNSTNQMSNGNITISYDIVEVDEAISKLSYDAERGYYIDSNDISRIIEKYVDTDNVDYIFACARLNDEKSSVPIKNWIGLGGMKYKGIGFSNIRMPMQADEGMYIYDEKTNTFPEEVFVHEFLHTLEQNAKELGYDVPNLHDNEKYGYHKNPISGLYDWYGAYMCKNIGQQKSGLDNIVYNFKPLHEDNFESSKNLDEFNDVQNIFERIALVCRTMYSGIKK